MLAATPNFRQIRVPNKMPLRTMIKEFLGVASTEDAQNLLRSIDSLGPEDQYLTGIVTRR